MEATDERIIEQLQAKVDAVRRLACCVCQRSICGHEILFSIAMGLGDKPHCIDCLAEGMGRPSFQLRDHLLAHFRQRDCYGEVWRRESTREGFPSDAIPRCLWPEDYESSADDALDESVDALEVADAIELAAETWDAGEMSCGDLVLSLRGRVNAMSPGARLKLTARDPGAPEDIPAWCRMTGHSLLAQHHPHYWIQRRE